MGRRFSAMNMCTRRAGYAPVLLLWCDGVGFAGIEVRSRESSHGS